MALKIPRDRLATLAQSLCKGDPIIWTRDHEMDENYVLFDPREILVNQMPIIVDRVRQFSAQSTPLERAREQKTMNRIPIQR